jgi:DNA repair protein RecN (Recombination protein N)
MLEELHISQFALIESLHLTFKEGFTVFSGETGAGKSILAGAMGLLAGSKATTEIIRSGADESEVTGVFWVRDSVEVLEWLQEKSLEPEDDRIIIRRIIRSNGKSGVYIQGTLCTLRDLTDLSQFLFDLHGQHEHQHLFDILYHRKYLDAFSGLEEQVKELTDQFLKLNTLQKTYDELIQNKAHYEREKELLQYAVNEIEGAKIQPDEDELLDQEKNRLESVVELGQVAEQIHDILFNDEMGAIRGLAKVRNLLQKTKELDPAIKDLFSRFESAYYELEDTAVEINQYKDTILADPDRLEEIQQRLDLLYKLKKKYGGTLDSVQQYMVDASSQLEQISSDGSSMEDLAKSIKDLERDVLQKANVISKGRKLGANKMEASVQDALLGLKMGKNSFKIKIEPKLSHKGQPICGPSGIDEIEFLLAANPGEPLKPLKSIASGGEISRIMLAIKAVLSDVEDVDTLVFDEIDSGIGGEVGAALGEYLRKASRKRQLFSITHLASIAVRADNHIRIEKVEQNGRTTTKAISVTGEDRVKEIARMLSGDVEISSSITHARELLQTHHRAF